MTADRSAPEGPRGLTTDFGGDALQTTSATPRLAWLPVADAAGYELEASVDGVALPAAHAATHRFTPWPWRPLGSRARVTWRVRAAGGAWSEPHRFEVGLLDADWSARWISPPDADGPRERRPAHRLSGGFEARGEVVSARLYATALGLYEARVNGVRAGTAQLTPGPTSYDTTLYAQAFDVTDAVTAGANRLDITVSDGWFAGEVGAFREPAQWGASLGQTAGQSLGQEHLAVRAELHLRFADGSTQVVGTDETWVATASEVTGAGLMSGQTTDATVAPGTPRPVLTGAVHAPPLDWSPAPPVRVVETRAPVAVTRLDADTVVADFGQNASGWIRLGDLGPAGTRTTIDFGEHTGADGDLDTRHLDAARPGEEPVAFVQRDEVVSGGRGQVFEPAHTVHGFRYARLRRPGGVPTDSLAMRVVHSDLAPTGTFACSDAGLNRLWDAARWSFRGNAVGIPTDCPTRERLGWTGDYQVFVSTATRLYDVAGFSRAWLRSVRDDQLDDGRIANFSPDGRQVKHNTGMQFAMMTGSAGWGDAIVHVPWELYRAYGDPAVLEENYDAMSRWVGWALGVARASRHASRVERSAEPAPHEEFLWDGSFHWGEWCEPKPRAADGTLIDQIQTNPMAWFLADKGEVGTAYLYRSSATLASIARLLGRDAEAARWAGVAEQVADAWRTEFLREDGRTAGDTQAGYVRALSFGLVPDALRAAAASRLVELVDAAHGHLSTGFLSTADLLPVLADTGHLAVAERVLMQRTSPSWLGMLDRGATTIWEDWDGVDDHGVAHESLNHYSKGAVVRFLHSHVLGLRQEDGSAGWERFEVAPQPLAGLTWASGSLVTPQGTIEVAWRDEGDTMSIDVTLPPACEATLVLPDGTRSRLTGPRTHAATLRRGRPAAG